MTVESSGPELDNFRLLFQRSTDAILLIEGHVIVDANPAALALFHCADLGELNGQNPLDFWSQGQPSGKASVVDDASLLTPTFIEVNNRFERVYVLPDGASFWAEVLLTSVALDQRFLSFAVLRDITKRKATECTLLMAAQVFENNRDAVLFTDASHVVLAVNNAFTEITGFSAEEVVGAQLPSLHDSMHDASFYQHIWEYVATHDYWQGEVWHARKDGAEYPVWVALTAIRDGTGQVANFMVMLADITDRQRSEERTRYLAEHDFLTDLPNRVLFLDRLQQALTSARRKQTMVAVMFLDLDRFKGINDRFGHHVGDAVLKEVAARLTGCVRGVDTVSRQGGDEFVVILADIGGVDQAAHVAKTVMQAVSKPVQVGEQSISVSVSIGISISPIDGDDLDTLLQHADVAMYHAKQNGRNAFSFFSSEMNAHVIERVEMANNLRQALANHEFELVYQPAISIESGCTTGVEALLRWRHPQRGLLTPDQFLQVAEDCGLMVPIGQWVLHQACSQARGWRDNGFPVVVAVNLSNAQFMDEALLHSVDSALANSGLAPEYLDLEITEGVIMNGTQSTVATVMALRERGVKLTIDDFGTGYSSLSNLRRFPLSKLKIDRSFVQDIIRDPADANIIPAIIAVARSLKLRVVAEGVETAEQLRFLREHGCDEYQGYYAGIARADPDLGTRHRK